MIDLKEQYGKRVKVSLEESWEEWPKTKYWIVKGKRGDVMAWDDKTLEVTVYGRKHNEAPGLPAKTHNLILPSIMEASWKAKAHYDDSTSFFVPVEQAFKAFKVIRAKNRRQATEAMRQRGRELASRMRSSKEKARLGGTYGTKSSETIGRPQEVS